MRTAGREPSQPRRRGAHRTYMTDFIRDSAPVAAAAVHSRDPIFGSGRELDGSPQAIQLCKLAHSRRKSCPPLS